MRGLRSHLDEDCKHFDDYVQKQSSAKNMNLAKPNQIDFKDHWRFSMAMEFSDALASLALMIVFDSLSNRNCRFAISHV